MRSYRKFTCAPEKCVLHFLPYQANLNRSHHTITASSRNQTLPRINTSGFQCYFSSSNTSPITKAVPCIKAHSPNHQVSHFTQTSFCTPIKYNHFTEYKKIPLLIKTINLFVKPKLAYQKPKCRRIIISSLTKPKMLARSYLHSLYCRVLDGII